MPRTIFLSFVGTNNYIACNYFTEGNSAHKASNVKYIQEAILQLYGQQLTSKDCAYFFLTKDARKMNWLSNRQWNRETGKYNKKNIGLRQRLQSLKKTGECNTSIKPIDIPDGFSSEEIWEIFQKVFQCIKEGDQVILDITHAFRYLPMLGMVLIHYAKALRNIEVKAIYYGAFEKLGPAAKVAKLSIEEKNAPIMNLVSFSELQNWTGAALDFVKYGKVSQLDVLTRKRLNPILIEAKGGDSIANNLNRINKKIQELIPLIQTNRGSDLLDFDFNLLNHELEKFSTTDSYIKPINEIVLQIKEKLNSFKSDDSLVWIKTTEWCLNHLLIQQGVTQLQEGLLTWFCLYFRDKTGYQFFNWQNIPSRNLISSALNILSKNVSENKWNGAALKNKKLTQLIIKDRKAKKLCKVYVNLGNLRNDINHGGYTKKTPARKFKLSLENFLIEIKKVVREVPMDKSSRVGVINLSNHPSNKWTQEQQKNAKKKYGIIEDLAFPNISPQMSKKELDQLVSQYFNLVILKNPMAVHLMGEMTFTFTLVNKLKSAGIKCIASTTNRIVEEKDGKKIVQFQFVQFREY